MSSTIEAFYGKTIEPKLQTILVEIQNEYNLTVPQVVGLLTIYDFFSRITLYDAHVSNLRLRENRDAELKHLPQKTREFFMGYKSCSEMTQFFCPSNTARYFKKFAKKILKNIKAVSDYVDYGLIEKVEAKKPIPTIFEYMGGDI